MNLTPRSVLRVVPALIVVLVVAVWACSYHSFEFKGGVGIRDSGFFSYPRYSIQIGEVPLWKDGEYQFTVRGLPPGPLDFALRVLDTTDVVRAQLTSSSTTLSSSIADGSGKEICKASGNLSDAINKDRSTWILASTGSDTSFWQPRCKHLPISRFKSYVIKVTVSGTSDGSGHKMLIPILQGGGNELP